MTERVRGHVERFNAAQRTGQWAPFVATFTEAAVMSFAGAPGAKSVASAPAPRFAPAPDKAAGPYEGRDAIGAAYEQQPPSDTMSVTSVASDGDTDVVRFAWDAGGTGTMTLRWRGDQVAGLHITFD